MADEATLPTEEEIAQLPRWARVAFAARCARRALPQLLRHWPNAPAEQARVMARAVEIAVQSTLTRSVNAARASTSGSTVLSHEVFAFARMAPTAGALQVGLTCAEALAAAETASCDEYPIQGDGSFPDGSYVEGDPYTEGVWNVGETLAQEVGRTAASAARAGIDTHLIRVDFHRILAESRRRKWTDDTRVPPSVFGPLDELAGEPHAKVLVIEMFAPEGTGPHVIGDSLVKLWEAANECHMAGGGGVLTFDEFKQMMPALVPVGPKSEG